MPYEELHRFSDDQRLLITMIESANDAIYSVCRSLELIEQSRSMLRELDIQRPRTDGLRKI
jgi:hypothetical protein